MLCVASICWIPVDPSADQWLQIDLLEAHQVGVVSMEYRPDMPDHQDRFKDIEVYELVFKERRINMAIKSEVDISSCRYYYCY